MALTPRPSMLFLAAVLVAPVVNALQPNQGGGDDDPHDALPTHAMFFPPDPHDALPTHAMFFPPDPHDSLPRYPLRPKRWSVSPWPRVAVMREKSQLQAGMDSWLEDPTVLETRNPVLMEESYGDPYIPSFSGDLQFVGPFGNPYDHSGLVVEQNEQPREEITLHPPRRLVIPFNKENFITNSNEITRGEMLLHSLWRPENPNDQGEILMDRHDQPVEGKFIVNPWTLRRPGYDRRPETVEVAKGHKNLGTPQPASTNKLIRAIPDGWNEFVINSIIKLKYGGDDVFDMSVLSWIPRQDILSPSLIENMLRWNQPDGGGILVPIFLKGIDSSVARFDDQGKWQFPGNSLQIYTVPLSIVRLFGDSMKTSHVQAQSIRKEPKEALWYDLEESQGSPGEDGGLHLPNRHSVDFRDYHDFDLVRDKKIPQKDPVLLGQEYA